MWPAWFILGHFFLLHRPFSPYATNPLTCSAECSPCSASGALFSSTALPFRSASGRYPSIILLSLQLFWLCTCLLAFPPCCQVRNLPVLDFPSQHGLHFPNYYSEAQNDVGRRGMQDLWISAHSLDLAFSEEDYLLAGQWLSKNFSCLGPQEICLPVFV